MSIPTVSYEEFSTSNQALVGDHGPWIVPSDTPATIYEDVTTSWCDGLCLSCRVYPGYELSTYQASFTTNISVNLANYGGATSLAFTWNYWPLYCGSNTTTGSNIPIISQVGDATFDESFPSVDYNTFFNGPTDEHEWENDSKISHNSSTSLVLGSDPNLGYIAINISSTMAYSTEGHQEYLNFYIKDIEFLITTPIQSAVPSSSPAASAISTQQADGSSAPSSSTTPSGEVVTSSTTTPAGVVAGAVIGALAFVVLFIIAVCRFQRRNSARNTTTFPGQTNLKGAIPPPRFNHSAHRTSFAPNRPGSSVSSETHGSLPTYPPDELNGQDSSRLTSFSPELAQFAAANREAINASLEARLQAAGYVPTEDPSRLLTSDEWKNEYGVTKLELRRLQNLYARTQQDQPQ